MTRLRLATAIVLLLVGTLLVSCAGDGKKTSTADAKSVAPVTQKAETAPPAGGPEGDCWCKEEECTCVHCKEKKAGTAKPKRCDCCG